MQKAVNPQTGEVLFLVNGQWAPPAQTAVNEAGSKAFLVGNEWVVDQQPALGAPAPQAETPQAPQLGQVAPPPAPQITPETAPPAVPAQPAAEVTPEAPQQDLAMGQELRRGFMTGVEQIKGMPNILGLQVDAEAVARTNKAIQTYDAVDRGDIKSAAEASQKGFNADAAQRYLRASPEVREQMRTNRFEQIAERKDSIQEAVKLYAQFQKDVQQYAGKTPNVTDVASVKDFGNWLAFNFGAGAAQIAPILLAAATMGPAGGLAVGTAFGFQEGISQRLEAVQEKNADLPPEKQADAILKYLDDTGDVTALIAIASGSLDLAGPVASLLRRKASQELAKKGGMAYTKQAIKDIPRDVLEEGITGAAQEVLQLLGERYLGEQEGDLFTVENFKRVADASAAEAAGGLAGSSINITTATGKDLLRKRTLEIAEKKLAEEAAVAEPETPEVPTAETPAVVEPETPEAPVAPAELDADTWTMADEERLGEVEPTEPVSIDDTPDDQPFAGAVELDAPPFDVDEPTTPTAPPAPTTSVAVDENAVIQRAEEIKSAYNVPETIALAMARRELEEGGIGDGIPPTGTDIRADESGVSVPTVEQPTPGGPDPLGADGLAGTEGSVSDVAGREGISPDTLTPEATTTETPTTSSVTVTGDQNILSAPTEEPPTVVRRGRKKLELSPEEAELRQQSRAGRQKELTKAARGVERVIKMANVKVDPTKFETPEQAKIAQTEADANRRQALYVLQKAALDPKFRGTKSQRDALAYLNSNAVTPKERADIKARLDFELNRSRGTEPLAAQAGKTPAPTSTAVPQFKKFTTAAQAAAYLKRKGNPFERLLAARLAPFLEGVRLVIAESKENTPQAIQDLLRDSSGVYHSVEFEGSDPYRMIVLRAPEYDRPELQGQNGEIFLHEALHAATAAKIDEWLTATIEGEPAPGDIDRFMSELFRVMAQAKERFDEQVASGAEISPTMQFRMGDKEGELDISRDPKEFVAYAMTDPEMQSFLMGIPGRLRKDQAVGAFRSLFNQFTDALRKLFKVPEGMATAFTDIVSITEGILQEEYFSPAVVKDSTLDARKKKVDKNLEKIRLSEKAGDIVSGVDGNIRERDFADFKDLMDARFSAMGNDFIAKTLYSLQSADILRWKGDELPGLKEVDDLTQRMAGMRMNMEKAFAKQADKFAAFLRKNGRKTIARAMHLARLNSVSPTLFPDAATAKVKDKRLIELNKRLVDPKQSDAQKNATKAEITKRGKAIEQVYTAWDALGKQEGGQQMYRDIRQTYKDMNVLTRTLLDERIERLGLEGDVKDPTTPKGKIMSAVRRMHEDSDFAGVEEYFPFMRYGQYWLRVKGPQGREFYMFESGVDRNTFLKRRAKELGVDTTDAEVFDAGDDVTALRKNYSKESQMLSGLFETIDKEFDKPDLDKDALKDQLYQVYLMTLPEESYRKQWLHAENVTGFSSDVFRNFTTSATRIAAQAAKLAYGDKIQSQLERAEDSLAGKPAEDKAKLRLFIDEFNTRAQDELNPSPESMVAAKLNQFAFYWLLTGVASAIVQTTSVPILVMPTLTQDYGYVKSSAKFAKYLNFFRSVGVTEKDKNGDVTFVAPTMGESSIVKNNPVLRKAFEQALEKAITTENYASVLANTRRTPDNAYVNLPGVALRTSANIMSGLFTGAERMAREMSFMMAFELEYDKTKDFDKSVQKATDVVYELLGRYDNFNRPQILRNPIGRTVGQFKMYAVVVTSFFVRNMYNAMKVTNPKEALPALHRLSGVLLMGGLFHGMVGMPLYSTIALVIDYMLDWFEGEEEEEKRYAENPIIAGSSDLRFRYEFLPKYFGDVMIPGLDGKDHSLATVLEKGPISTLTDINIGSRTTFDGLWWRVAPEGRSARETFINYAMANLGPSVSTGINMSGAADDFDKGNTMKGLEKLIPAFFKNPLVAARLAKEGATTRRGDMIMDKGDFSDISLIAQALGFQSAKLARIREQSFELTQEVLKMQKERAGTLDGIKSVLSDTDSTEKDLINAFNKLDQFNRKFGTIEGVGIDVDTIFDSLDREQERQFNTFRGMSVPEKLQPYILPLRELTEPPR